MNQILAALDGAWKVLAAGVLLGAGLPALFALGIRAQAWGAGDLATITAEGVTTSQRNPLGTVLAWVLFGIVVLSVLVGISYIVAHGFGYTLGFDGLLPTFKKK
jgi:hypothetical protein